MPFQPPSIMQACMILLAAPKLAISLPTDDLSLVARQEDPEDPVPVPTPDRSPTPQPQTPDGSATPIIGPDPEPYYAFQGCYSEPKKGRALDHVWIDHSMTPELCAAHAADYAYYGVEYGYECWYGNTLRKGSTQRDDDECKKPCPGDPEQTCGDGMRLNLWRRTDAHIPVDQPQIGDYHLQGCYVDTLNPRALRRVLGDDGMTPQMCMEFCGGSTYMGLEYDALRRGSERHVRQPNRMDLYKLNSPAPDDAPFYSMGCYVDKGAVHRALPELYADDNMSWEMCAGFAARRGFKHFGVEYGRECWAGPQIDSLATPSDGCTFPCAGNDLEKCGGHLRLQMFTFDINDISTAQDN